MPESAVRKCRRSRAWRRARWREHVESQPRSGLCVVDYCQQHGLRRESFYRWRRVFAKDAAAETSSGAEAGQSALGAPLFAEVIGLAQAVDTPASGVELVLAGERRICLAPGFDEDTLRRAVAVLESLPC